MPELIFRNPENDRIHIGYIVRSEDKTQYTQEEEGKYIKKNVHVITLSQYDPSWTSLLFGIFIAIDLICAAFFGLFAYIFTEFS